MKLVEIRLNIEPFLPNMNLAVMSRKKQINVLILCLCISFIIFGKKVRLSLNFSLIFFVIGNDKFKRQMIKFPTGEIDDFWMRTRKME